MREEILILAICVVFVGAGLTLLVVTMNNRRYMRELAHRERMAMIERGLVPAPESDPVQFEALGATAQPVSTPRRGDRFRTVGVVMIGLGLGLGFLIAASGGESGVGIGVGGAWVALGAASLLNYFLIRTDR